MHKIFIISGGTGRTVKKVVNASLIQYPNNDVDIVTFSDIRTKLEIRKVIIEAKKYNALIGFALMDNKLRKYIKNKCKKEDVIIVDVMGDMVYQMSKLFSTEPLQTPGLFNKLNHDYFQRIDAVQFTFKHDDGARVEDIHDADIVLLGVSRTFKTPLSVYLAYKGFFVMNIPIIDGMQPDKIIQTVDPKKIFCLNTYANKLSELRQSRNKKLGKYVEEYTDMGKVKSELKFAMRYYNLHSDWNIVNVTGKPIEEIASEILDTLGKIR